MSHLPAPEASHAPGRALASGEGGLKRGRDSFRSQVLTPTRSRGAARTSHLLIKAFASQEAPHPVSRRAPHGCCPALGLSAASARSGASSKATVWPTGAGARPQSPLPLLPPAHTPGGEPRLPPPPFLSVGSAGVTRLHRGERAPPRQDPAHLPSKSPLWPTPLQMCSGVTDDIHE